MTSWIDLDALLPAQARALLALRPQLQHAAVMGAQRVPGYVALTTMEDWHQKHRRAACWPTDNARLAPGLLRWAKTLPFVDFGRVMICPRRTKPHYDRFPDDPRPGDEFIWGQVGDRRFYVETPAGRSFVTSTLATFDSKRIHGVEEPAW